jgi:peptidoglycan/LPS O-acetylase OafA/YrhL
LRALAVVLVLLYHAQVPGISGGYVGVDVFFVLSGFLITGILLRERAATGRISLTNFYARRARRILPASALVLLVTVAVSAIVLPPLRMADIAQDAAAAGFYVSNIRFGIQATDYLQSQLPPSPLQHYWSLGVEEQFYVFWPAIVLLVTRGGAALGRRVGLAALLISGVSFAASLWLTSANGPWAFFSLPTRAWELGIGAMLAVAGTRLALVPVRVAVVMGWVGLSAIALSGVLLNPGTPFPGTAALLPTVGAGLVIAGGVRQSAFAAGRLLGMAAPRYIGRISYSLYLWHWPLIVIPTAAVGATLPLPARLGLMGLAFVLAAASQRWVEEPIRRGRVVGTRPIRNLAMAAGLSAVVAASSFGVAAVSAATLGSSSPNPVADTVALNQIIGRAEVVSNNGAALGDLPVAVDGPVPAAVDPPFSDVQKLPDPYADGCQVTDSVVDPRSCIYGDVHGVHVLVLFGDSHADNWWPPLELLARQSGWQLVTYLKSGCSPADLYQPRSGADRIYTECVAWRETALAQIASLHPDLVVVSGRTRTALVQSDNTPISDAEAAGVWQDGLTRTLQRLSTSADRVVMLGDTPNSQLWVPICLSGHRDSILACATPVTTAVSSSWRAATAAAASAAGVSFLDPTVWVCPSSPCPPVVANFVIFRDNQHMTAVFASALAGRLASALPELGAGGQVSAPPSRTLLWMPEAALVEERVGIPRRRGLARRKPERARLSRCRPEARSASTARSQ